MATSDAALTVALTSLAGIEAKVKYISFEPLLGSMQPPIEHRLKQAGINWVIIGAQTKPYKPPSLEWVREIVEAADKAGAKVFLKNNMLKFLNHKSPEELIKKDKKEGKGGFITLVMEALSYAIYGMETNFAFDESDYYRQEMPF